MAWMVTIITFAASAAIVLGIWVLYIGESSQEVVRGRIEHLRAAQSWTGIAADLKLVRDEMVSSIPLLHKFLVRAPGATWAQKGLSQAGLKTKPAKIFLVCIVLGVVAYVVIDHYLPIYFAFPAGVLATLIPIGIVAYQRHKRLSLFEERFPDALDMLGRAVRAGHAFTSAMQLVAQEAPE